MSHLSAVQNKPSGRRTLGKTWRRLLWNRDARELGVLGSAVRLGVLLIFFAFFAVPILWLLLAPSKTNSQLVDLSPLAFGSVARYLEAGRNLLSFNGGQIVTWARNSVFYVLGSLVLSIAVAVPAGYALAVARFRGRTAILWLTLITMMLPGSALVLPQFLEMNMFGLINTPWAVILPASFFPFGVWLTYIYYASSMPPDLLDAGRVDGCSEARLFWYLGLPLAKPLLGLLAFISFNSLWNNYYGPFVMINTDKLYNLPVGIQTLITGTTALRATGGSILPLYRAEVALAGLVMVVPVAIIFVLSQRFVVSGAYTGATKG